jgi:hypothetical protein
MVGIAVFGITTLPPFLVTVATASSTLATPIVFTVLAPGCGRFIKPPLIPGCGVVARIHQPVFAWPAPLLKFPAERVGIELRGALRIIHVDLEMNHSGHS